MAKSSLQTKIETDGFAVTDSVYSTGELAEITRLLDNLPADGPAFRRSGDLFAIRQLLKQAPALEKHCSPRH